HDALLVAAVAEIVKVDHLADVGQAEADPLAAQDPGEAGAVAPAVDAGHADPLRRDQPLILIEAQRAGGDAEFVAQFGDRVGARLAVGLTIVGMERVGHAADYFPFTLASSTTGHMSSSLTGPPSPSHLLIARTSLRANLSLTPGPPPFST